MWTETTQTEDMVHRGTQLYWEAQSVSQVKKDEAVRKERDHKSRQPVRGLRATLQVNPGGWLPKEGPLCHPAGWLPRVQAPSPFPGT